MPPPPATHPFTGHRPLLQGAQPSPDRGQAAGGAQRGLQPCSRLPVCTREPDQDHSGRQVGFSESLRGRCSPVLSIAILVPATWHPAQVWSASDHVITANTAGHHSSPRAAPKRPVPTQMKALTFATDTSRSGTEDLAFPTPRTWRGEALSVQPPQGSCQPCGSPAPGPGLSSTPSHPPSARNDVRPARRTQSSLRTSPHTCAGACPSRPPSL